MGRKMLSTKRAAPRVNPRAHNRRNFPRPAPSHLVAMKSVSPLAGFVAGAVLFLAGCTTRSISNSGFENSARRYGAQIGGYVGELSELDVIGVTADAVVTEADIHTALEGPRGAKLSRSSKVLLIQSGADYPDAPMLEAMQGKFAVSSFSGRPAPRNDATATLSKSLRLIAARGGYDTIVCYWGVLESARENKITSVVSWVPLVGSVIPDEREHMRLRLKAAIVDVASGRWTFVNPPSVAASELSARVTRKETDQGLVENLKAEGYRTLARTLAENHTE